MRWGQATMVSALVMVLLSVLLASVVFYWAFGVRGQSASEYQSAIYRSNYQASEQFNIEEILFNNTVNTLTSPPTNRIKIFVRNFGDVPVRIIAIYITNFTAGKLLYNYSNPASAAVPSRSASSITLAVPASEYNSWKGGTVSIRLASSNGNLYERSFKVQ